MTVTHAGDTSADSSPAPTSDGSRELPYGGTVAEYRLQVALRAGEAQQRFEMLLAPGDIPLTVDMYDAAFTAAHAASDAWAVAALLRWITERIGADAGYEAASIAQDMGYDGDAAGLCADLVSVDLDPPQPNFILRALPVAWALVEAQQAMLNRYADSDQAGRNFLWQQLHHRGDELHDILAGLTTTETEIAR